ALLYRCLSTHRYRRLAFQLTPADDRATDGSEGGFDGHVVHQLPIQKPLKHQPNEEMPIFLALQQESDKRREQIKREEEGIVEQHALEGIGRIVKRVLIARPARCYQ